MCPVIDYVLSQTPRLLAHLTPNAQTTGHDDLLYLRRAAGVQRDDAGPLEHLHVTVGLVPLWVVGQRVGAEYLQDRFAHTKARRLAIEGRLRPLVGQLLMSVPHPVVAKAEQPLNLGLDKHVDQQFLNLRVFAYRLAVALKLGGIVEQPVHQPVAAYRAA